MDCCPVCGGRLIVDEAWDHIMCDTCGAEWKDGYRIDEESEEEE